MTIRRLLLFLLLLALAGAALLGWSYWSAIANPIVRQTSVTAENWPPGEPPMRVLLISDIHVAGPDMPPARLERIVAQMNALWPDAVLIAGDLVSDKRAATRRYPLLEAVAPLSRLRSRFGSFAVLGNHDHWRDEAEAKAALRAARVTVLDNEAAMIGPLLVGGLDDAFTGQDDLPQVLRQMTMRPGVRLLLSHSPDPFPRVPPWVRLMLGGHTHCGQMRLPWVGALTTMSTYGERYACGRVDEDGKVLVVGAGLGTSVLPLRLLTPPDMWLVTIGPSAAAPQASSSMSQ
ncbi:MAG TPA: metallophosphoesterase [Allosphingosinicella sp.]|jgi:hypothetical protein